MPKKWYTSKTIVVNFFVIIAALLTYTVSSEFPIKLDEQTVTTGAAILGAVNIILRLVTNQPVTK